MKCKRRLLTLGLLAFVSLQSLAEPGISTLEATRSEWSTYRFPLLEGESKASERINIYLHAFELDGLPGRFEQSPFERVWPQEDVGQGVVSLDYEIHAKTPGFLSLAIIGEYYGPYLSLGRKDYAFDLADGSPLSLSQLFSEQGLQNMRRRISQARVERLETFLAQLSANSASADDAETAEIQRGMYEECLPRHRETNLDHSRLLLGPTQLTLVAGRCSAHAVRALDDLGEFSNSFAYTDLAQELSPYGRCLLLEQRSDCRDLSKPQISGVYRGVVNGRQRITLVIAPPDAGGSSRAFSFRNEDASRVELSARQEPDAGRILLREQNARPALFELLLERDGQLSGTWQEKAGPQVPVELR
ncbi:hypothetical protein [Stutzerimonas stutzeri]|uniref:hypothetical protein n=1 Tax=Stutzerimonas stutzeri TaxID=316 RepID=UPI00210C20E8|nr:hypothetical protein [Stutzerimonas stutzeri]MCQ4259647.1 hypothetical protein [Stutzerimonas stutzeri]